MKRSEKKALEAQLCRLGDGMPQIDLAQIKRSNVVTPPVQTGRYLQLLKRAIPVLCTVCALLLVIGAPLGMLTYDAMNTTTLYVETVETARLTVAANGKVREVYYAGSFVPEIASDSLPGTMLAIQPTTELLAGMQVEEAVDMVLAYMVAQGSVEQGCEVVISAICKNENRGAEMIRRASEAVKRNEDVVQAQATVVSEHSVQIGKGEDTQNSSPARDKYLAELLASMDNEYLREELESFSTGFLRFLCAEREHAEQAYQPISDAARDYYERYRQRYEDAGKDPQKPGHGNQSGEQPKDTSGLGSAVSSVISSIVDGMEGTLDSAHGEMSGSANAGSGWHSGGGKEPPREERPPTDDD